MAPEAIPDAGGAGADRSGPGGLRASAAAGWARARDNPSVMILANTATQSVLRMASNIVLARLLAPSAFALIAITSLILTGIEMVSDVGIAITALRETDMSREDEHRLWTMQLVRGIGVGALMAAAAAPVSWLYQDARLGEVLLALGLMPILQGARSLYPVLAMAQRRLLPSTLLEIGARAAGIAVSIAIAFVSPTVWSLVIGTLASVAAATIGSFVLAGYRPRFVWDRRYIAAQWRFSRWIQFASTLYFLGGQIDKPLFPFLFGMTSLGVYGIGTTLAAMPTQVTQRWSASVFYPLTTRLLRGDGAARARLLRVRTTMLLYTATMTLGVAAIAPAFFTLLYRPQYWAAAGFAQILAIGIFLETAESSLRHMPLVEGTPHYELWAVVAKLLGFGAGLAAVVAFGGSAFAYAAAVTFGGLVAHVFMLIVCVRRGYVRPGPDCAFLVVLIAAAVTIRLVPVPTGTAAMIGWGGGVAAVGAAAMLLIYRRRGLPSLSAEPAPEVLRAAAEEETGLQLEAI